MVELSTATLAGDSFHSPRELGRLVGLGEGRRDRWRGGVFTMLLPLYSTCDIDRRSLLGHSFRLWTCCYRHRPRESRRILTPNARRQAQPRLIVASVISQKFGRCWSTSSDFVHMSVKAADAFRELTKLCRVLCFQTFERSSVNWRSETAGL